MASTRQVQPKRHRASAIGWGSSILRHMKKTIVYIDGYNLYYGLLKGTSYKWLDLVKFAKLLLPTGYEVVEVKYFTSCALTYPHDPASVERQNIYLQALRGLKSLKIIKEFFKKNKVMMPVYEESCCGCPTAKNGYVRVVKLEEKRSDVNLAVEMLVDASVDEVDSLVLITGDSDQVGTIEAVRSRFGKEVIVCNPHPRFSTNLKNAADSYKNIARNLPAVCQLSDEVSVGTHGSVARRPEAWR